jgi:hypothetical protein
MTPPSCSSTSQAWVAFAAAIRAAISGSVGGSDSNEMIVSRTYGA